MNVFTACRLIALDKCPGVQLIGVGKVARQIVGKAVLSVMDVEIQQAEWSLQLCAGQPSGCEAALHALRHIFDDATTQAALLVDASNAFNNLNYQLAWQTLLPYVLPSYHNHASLFDYFITGRNNSGRSLGHGHVYIDTDSYDNLIE